MTVLLLDLGNSRWKMTIVSDGQIGPVQSGDYADPAALSAVAGRNPESISAIWLSSVAGNNTTRLIAGTLQDALAAPVRQVDSMDPMPDLVSGYRRPEQLGIDRLLAMVAARARTQKPLCVVDAGTAVTIDFVDSTGQHLGGFILPGQRLFRDCLLANTSIPRDDRVESQAVLGRDTPTAVALAGRYAVTGIVERFTSGSAKLFPGQEVQVFVGGGDSDLFSEILPRPCIKLDHLVLRGLAVMAAGGDS